MPGMLKFTSPHDCAAPLSAGPTQRLDLVHYRGGRQVANEDNGRWLMPAFAEMHRVLLTWRGLRILIRFERR